MPSSVTRFSSRTRLTARVGLVCATLGIATGALAQDAVPPRGPDAPTPPAAPASDAGKNPPRSLDELLGVPSGGAGGAQSGDGTATADSADDAARREQEKRLERSLNEASMQDLVARALEGMKTAADRLTDAKDPGLGTQRVQEEVVRTLDRLLEEAQKRQGKKSSSSKSSSRRQQQKQNDGKQDPSERNGQQQRQSRQNAGTESSASDPGDGDKGDIRDDVVAETSELNETRIEWGQLPERVRELVLQGRRDRVSTIYERLTREYYRRLAEEASR
jgi:hypothetical protein